MNHRGFLQLIHRIRVGSKTSFEGEQLCCSSHLVYYCGVLAREIPKLKVGQVVAKDGAIIGDIVSCGAQRTIHLNGEALAALER